MKTFIKIKDLDDASYLFLMDHILEFCLFNVTTHLFNFLLLYFNSFNLTFVPIQ